MFELMETITLALIPTFLLLDFVWRARKYETTRFWRLRGLLMAIGVVLFSGEIALWYGKLLGNFHLFEGAGLSIWGGAIVGILVYEFFHYWYHRLAHQWNWLWYAGHQVHHSAESLDAFGALYQHPFDAFMFASITSLVFYPLLGLVPEAGMIGVLFLTFNAMFQHANIRTPYWLGFFIQRPESHAVHHGKGIHRHNYADLPLWDMMFGSFHNPTTEHVPAECGFYKGASSRLLAMLIGRDVSTPPEAKTDDIALAKQEAA